MSLRVEADWDTTEEMLARHDAGKLRAMAEEDFYFFCRWIMGYPDLHEELHRPICEWLAADIPEDFKVFLIPRGHFKTTLASICLPMWWLLKDPTERILIAHAKDGTATKILGSLKAQMEYNPVLRKIADDRLFEDPANEVRFWREGEVSIRQDEFNPITLKDPNVMSAAVGKDTTGLHWTRIILDDLVGLGNYQSPTQREKVKEYVRQINAQLQGGKVLVIGTTWHFDDLYNEILEEDGPYAGQHQVRRMTCWSDDECTVPIFPKRHEGQKSGHTRKTLELLRKRMGPTWFAAQYENNPVPKEHQRFRPEYFQYFDTLPQNRRYNYYTAVDPSHDVENHQDPCVVMTGAWDNKGNLWVIDITRGHASGIEMQAWIRGHVAKYNPRCVMVERVGMQAQLKHWLRHDMMKDGLRFSIVETKRDRSHRKYPRIEALEPMAADGRLWIKNGFEALVYELTHLRAAKHDDMADCLADLYEFGQQPRADVDDDPVERLVVNSPWVMKDIVDRDLKQRELLSIDASSGWSVEF